MSAPFFILGFPRSGTSALRLHLACHPELVVAPECSFLTWLEPTYADWGSADVGSWRTQDFVADVIASRKFMTWRLNASSVTDRILQKRPRTYAELAACVYEAYAVHVGKPGARWGDKNNIHINLAADLATLYPTAQFVQIVRDVRDVLASVRDVNRLSPDLEYRPQLPSNACELATMWRDQNAAALDAVGSLGAERYLLIRYEDFVADPRSLLDEITAFLGVGWDDLMLSAPDANRRELLEPVEVMPWKELTLQPLTTERVARWRRSILAAEADAAVAAAEPVFTSVGYRT